MKNKIPNITVTEDEASKLIAMYGNKPAPEKRAELLANLGNQRELFTKEHEQQMTQEKSGRERGQ